MSESLAVEVDKRMFDYFAVIGVNEDTEGTQSPPNDTYVKPIFPTVRVSDTHCFECSL